MMFLPFLCARIVPSMFMSMPLLRRLLFATLIAELCLKLQGGPSDGWDEKRRPKFRNAEP